MKKILLFIAYFSIIACYAELKTNMTVLTWNYPETNNSVVFKVYRTTNPPSSSKRIWEVIQLVKYPNNSIRVSNLGTNKNYYMVSCSNVWGETMFFAPEYKVETISIR